MTSKSGNLQPLSIKDCAILNIATGVRAKNLKELRDRLLTIHPESITYHFWAKRLRPGFEEREYNNDFAAWAYTYLHDNKLAERLGLINPGILSDTEELRAKVVEVVELRLEENETTLDTKEREQFHFIRSEITLFDTQNVISKPEELTELLPNLSLGSIYFHFIDTKKGSNDQSGDISLWISGFGADYKELSEQISKLNPYFFTLTEFRTRVFQIFKDYFKGAVT